MHTHAHTHIHTHTRARPSASVALQGVKCHDSDLSFEGRVTMLQTIGVDVGTKNHSRWFVPHLRSSFHAVTCAGLELVLTKVMPAIDRPPPFCLLADKATLQRVTGQMHGVIVMIEGELKALMLSVLEAPDSTGLGLANILVDTCTGGKPLNLSRSLLQRSSTGLAFDGQYQSANEGHASGLQVKTHYCKLVNLNPEYVISRWDGAHRIELGANTVRSANSCWKDLAAFVCEVQSSYLYGKGYDRVRKTVAQLKEQYAGVAAPMLRFFAIGHVCDSRFMWSERRVYKNFGGNLVTFIADMADRVENSSDRNLVSKLNQARSVTFQVHLFGIIDLLRHVKDLSLNLQAVNRLPWETTATVGRFVIKMDQLAVQLQAENATFQLPGPPETGSRMTYQFEFLQLHLPDIRKQELHVRAANGTSLQKIDLCLRGRRVSERLGSPAVDVSQAVTRAFRDLAKVARELSTTLGARLKESTVEANYILAMSKCLDFTQMISNPAYCTEECAKAPLRKLYTWLCTRSAGAADPLQLVGSRIEVFWTARNYQGWYAAKVVDWRARSGGGTGTPSYEHHVL